MTMLRQLARRVKRRVVSPPDRIAPRAENPFATHIPILLALPRLTRIRRVVEFGAGHFSTGIFLNREAYPDLESLVSLENDREWYEQLLSQVEGDARIDFRLTDGAISDAVETVETQTADLVFIDDSTCAVDRSATIRAVLATAERKPLIVIHDFEVPDYQPRCAEHHREVRI